MMGTHGRGHVTLINHLRKPPMDETPIEIPRAQQVVTIPQWQTDIPVAYDEQQESYIPVRAVCAFLGIAHQMQIRRIKDDAVLSSRLHQFGLKHPRGGGTQPTWCIKMSAVGWWLATLSLGAANIRPELVDGLIDFQEHLFFAADQQLRGAPPAMQGIPPDPQLQQLDADFRDARFTIDHLHQRIGKVASRFDIPTEASDDSDTPEYPFTQTFLHITQWDAQFPVACDADATLYIPIKALCGYLGIAHQMQIKRMKEDPILSKRIRRFILKGTKGGAQPTWCIKLNATGWWLATISINASNVRAELRDGLLDFQEALLVAADQILRGDDAQTPSAQQIAAFYHHKMQQYDAELLGLCVSLARLDKRVATVERMIVIPEHDE
jgi:P22_AR N-terminal domain